MRALSSRRSVRPVAVIESMDNRRYCDGDNSFATAADLGAVSSYTVKNPGNLTSGSDTKDYYKFTVPAGSTNFAVKLGALGSNADLYLYNSSKTQIASSTSSGSTSEVLIQPLAAGTYYAEARLKSGSASTSYYLKLANDQAGNSTATAKNTGTLAADSTKVFSDYAGSLDGNDYYKFNTTTNGKVTLQLSGLSANADLQLLSSGGTSMAFAANLGTTSEQISLTLPTGTYYARVLPQSLSVDTKYTLTLKGPPADVPNTIPTARSVTTPYTISQTIGNGDQSDYFKFDLADYNYASMKLTTNTGTIHLAYYDASGTIVGADIATAGNPAELSYFAHTGGVRYVGVLSTGGLSTYTLSLKTQAF